MTRTVGPFVLESALSQGGMGSVWTARHPDNRQPVALKLMLPRSGGGAWMTSRFHAEVRAVARLEHPHIVRVLDMGTVEHELREADGTVIALEGSPWLAMELLDGASLHHRCAQLSWEQALVVLLQLLDALAHAHARGVIHRDLKPGNVQLSGRGAVLLDFGLALAKEVREGLDDERAAVGTAAYMAPEQVRGDNHHIGPWTDLYAFGCLAWALLTGSPPFGRTRSHDELCADQLLRPPPYFAPSRLVPPGVEPWLRRLLAKEWGARFLRASDAAEALRALAGLGVDPGPPPVEPPPPARPPMTLVRAGLGLYGIKRLPVIGRGNEKEALWQRILGLRQGRGGVVVLQGGAGCGKSSLAAELSERAAELGLVDPMVVVHGQTAGPEDGLGPAVARLLRVQGLAEAGIRAQLAIEGSLGEADRPALLALLTGRSAGAAERHAALRRLLEGRSAARPLLLWLDDVQWGSDALAFVTHLATRGSLDQSPILVVITAREMTEESVEAQLLDRVLSHPSALRVEVGPLPPGPRRALIHGLLRVEDPLAREIEARTEGNPLFAVQLVEAWVKRGALVPGEAGFVLEAGRSPAIPADLHGLWQERVDRALAPRAPLEREALELAAVLGMTVDMAEWRRAALGAGLWIGDTFVEVLVRAGLLQPPVEGRFSFIHALLRESIVRAATEAGRVGRWHRAAATALRAQGEGAALRLGRHLLALDAYAEALPALTNGAWGLVRRSEYLAADVALAERERAVNALGLGPFEAARVEGALMRARVARRLGDRAAAQRWTEEADLGAVRGGHRALRVEALRERCRLAQHAGRRRLALRMIEQAEALCPPGLTRAWCQRDRGLLLVGLGEPATAPLLEAEAVFGAEEEYFGRATCRVGRATAQDRRGGADPGLLDAAEADFERALRVQEPAWSWAGLGDVARLRGAPAQAAARYEMALARLKEIGAPGTDELRLQQVRVLLELGRVDEARPWLQALLQAVLAEGRPGLLASVYAYHALAAAIGEEWAAVDHLLGGVEAEVRGEGEPDVDRDQVIVTLALRCAAAGEQRRADRALRLRTLDPDSSTTQPDSAS